MGTSTQLQEERFEWRDEEAGTTNKGDVGIRLERAEGIIFSGLHLFLTCLALRTFKFFPFIFGQPGLRLTPPKG